MDTSNLYTDQPISLQSAYNKGLFLEKGQLGKAKDEEKAAWWYNYAALRGHSGAMFRLGRCYFEGRGVNEDRIVAAYWLRQSATEDAKSYIQGHFPAEEGLGASDECEKGLDYDKDTERDHEKDPYWSFLLYDYSARRGNRTGMSNGGTTIWSEDKLPSEVIECRKELSGMWWREAAKCGSTVAANNLLKFLGQSLYTDVRDLREESDSPKAPSYRLSSMRRDPGGPYIRRDLSIHQAYEKGVSHFYEQNKDDDEAFYWISYAAFRGHKYACFQLGRCYLEGIGTSVDLIAAQYYLNISGTFEARKLSQQAFPDDCVKTPEGFHERGLGYDAKAGSDPAAAYWAKHFFYSAAMRGHLPAMLRLAQYYFTGKGVDLEKEAGLSPAQISSLARTWWERAAKCGSLEAINMLRRHYGEDLYPDAAASEGNAPGTQNIDEEVKEGLGSVLSSLAGAASGTAPKVRPSGSSKEITGTPPATTSTVFEVCPTCHGAGLISRTTMQRGIPVPSSQPCPECKGSGRVKAAKPLSAAPVGTQVRQTSPQTPPEEEASSSCEELSGLPYLEGLPKGADIFEDLHMTRYEAYKKSRSLLLKKGGEGMALHYLLWAAVRGDGWAQYMMGRAYYYGSYNLEKSTVMALSWINEARKFKSEAYLLAQEFYEENLKSEYQGTTEPRQALIWANNARTGEGGTKKDIALSLHYMKMAAEGGQPVAMNNYGLYLLMGMGCEKNREEALMWLMRSAATGNLDALKNLRVEFGYDIFPLSKTYKGYTEPQGPKCFMDEHRGESPWQLYLSYRNLKDWRFREELKKYLAPLVEKGQQNAYAAFGWIMDEDGKHPGTAAFHLAEAYRLGYGEEASYGIEDFDWDEEWEESLETARDEDENTSARLHEFEFLVYDIGYTCFASELGDLYYEAWNSLEDIDIEIEEAWPKTMRAYCQGAVCGYYRSMYKLGLEFYHGRASDAKGETGEPDYARAHFWFQKSASHIPGSSTMLGDIYYYGDGVTKSFEKAFEFYKSAAEGGDTKAMNSLGIMYYNGEYVTRDYTKAYEMFCEAADGGNMTSLFHKATMLYDGLGVKSDWREAKRILSDRYFSYFDEAKELLKKIKKEHPFGF